MTAFDIVVPLAALSVGVALWLFSKRDARRLDRKLRDRHPAE